MTPYCTLVFARIVQESALSVGGNQPHDLVDSPLARDGKGRPVLRGSTLAGCFIASARALAGQLPQAITSPINCKSDPLPSVWRVAHAHPLETTQSGFFQHVSIDPRTQAAKDDHLFNLEALPTGTAWNFELEIVPAAAVDFAELEALAAVVLAEWEKPGGARLGRGSRHGYGWCHLEDISIVRMDTSHTSIWPDAFAPERNADEWIAYFRSKEGVQVLDLSAFVALHTKRLESRRALVQLTGMIQVGERTDDFGQGYGLDTLSIGGHARMQLQAAELFKRVIAPRDIPFHEEEFDPDFAITAIPGPDGQLVPYIPGASIRGVWRSRLSRSCQANSMDPELIEVLFGSTARAGCLSVADALINEDWQLLWQQHVAIDEFTGGAFASAKFDRLSIANATFRWRASIEGKSMHEAKRLAEHLSKLLRVLGDGQMPLGGGIWQGHGHIRWTLDSGDHSPISHGESL